MDVRRKTQIDAFFKTDTNGTMTAHMEKTETCIRLPCGSCLAPNPFTLPQSAINYGWKQIISESISLLSGAVLAVGRTQIRSDPISGLSVDNYTERISG